MDNYIKKIISDTLGETTSTPETKKGNKSNASGGVTGTSKSGVEGSEAKGDVAGTSNKGVGGAENANKSGVAGTSKDDVLGTNKANNGGVAGASKDDVLGTNNANNSGVAGTSKNGVLGSNTTNNNNAVLGEKAKGEVQSTLVCECLVVKPCDKQSLGMAFVPNQVWKDDLFEPETALDLGTAFPCLFKPFHGGGKK